MKKEFNLESFVRGLRNKPDDLEMVIYHVTLCLSFGGILIGSQGFMTLGLFFGIFSWYLVTKHSIFCESISTMSRSISLALSVCGVYYTLIGLEYVNAIFVIERLTLHSLFIYILWVLTSIEMYLIWRKEKL